MKLLNEIYDKDVFDKSDDTERSKVYKDRISTRSILLNDKDKVAMIHFKRSDLYMLPGGKQDKGETLEDSLLREIKEETGYDAKIIEELGLVIDYKQQIKQRNYNYGYLARITGNEGNKKFTENESKNGIPELVWLSLADAIKTQGLQINTNEDTLYITKFIQAVQKCLLDKYQEDLKG